MRTMQNVGVLFTYSKYIISDTKELVQNIEMITGVQVGSCAVQSYWTLYYLPTTMYLFTIDFFDWIIDQFHFLHTYI